MALPNNPTPNEVVKGIKDLENNKAEKADLPTNYVTTNTTQTITGLKTLEHTDTSTVSAQALILKGDNLNKTTNPSSNRFNSIEFNDKNDANIAKFSAIQTSDGWTGFLAGAGSDPINPQNNLLMIANGKSKLLLIPSTSSHTSSAVRRDFYNTNTVTDVSYDSTNKKITKTKNNSTIDVVTFGANAFNSTTIPTSYVSSINGSTGAVTNIETTINKVTSLSSSSTDTEYPSAKCVYDAIGKSNEIGSSTSGTATDIVALGSGHYVWKAGTYVKIGSGSNYVTYQNTSSDDISFMFDLQANQCIFVGQMKFSSSTVSISSLTTTYIGINGVYYSEDNYVRGKLNNSFNSSNFYAPTSSGSSGQVLQSNGSGAPVWVTPSGGGSVDIDNSSITKNSSDQIQTVGVIDQKTGNANKQWTGTLAEYNALGTHDANTFYNITDDANNGFTYTEGEQFTGRYWLGGKPIYCRAKVVTTPSSANTWSNVLTISSSKVIPIRINYNELYSNSEQYLGTVGFYTDGNNLYGRVDSSYHTGKTLYLYVEYIYQ